MKKLATSFLVSYICLFPLYSEDFSYFDTVDYANINLNLFHLENQKTYDNQEQEFKPDIEDKLLLDHPFRDNKKTILECAQTARQYANAHLELAEELLVDLKRVKDWRIKDRLKTLIASSIGTMLIEDPRAKFLSVALALLTDLVINEGIEKSEIAYKLYAELSYAAACLEEFKYYSRLSLDSTNDDLPNDEGWKYANFAIDDLTYADMLTASLEYKLHGGIVSSYITELRANLINDMIDNRQLTSIRRQQFECLLENFDEIAADCSERDRTLTNKIYTHLKGASEFLILAESKWKLRK